MPHSTEELDAENLDNKELLLPIPDYARIVESRTELRKPSIEAVLALTDEGATVPFIARYRKERTGGLDENDIRLVLDTRKSEENLYKAKLTALNGINEQGLLTDEIRANVTNAKTLKEVEDLYAPYRSKKKTKAMIAIENGFQGVADAIKKNRPYAIDAELLTKWSREEIIEGATEIIAAEIAGNAEIRDDLRTYLLRSGLLVSKAKSEKMLEKLPEKTKSEIRKFDLYSEFSQVIPRIKAYQTLALNRGENLGILTVKIDKDDRATEIVESYFGRGPYLEELNEAIKKGLTALFKSVENEIRGTLTDTAESESIRTFQTNLFQLLMSQPEYGQRVLGIDPGYRTGSKLVVLDELGNPLEFGKCFLDREDVAISIVQSLAKKHSPTVVVVGNGTASEETVALIQKCLDLPIYIVNESGASVYSASETAQEEFPELDVTDRGTVSIARRFVDPLSELVKVPVGSIWVGMYQHDVSEKKLEEELGRTVEDAVNQVGVNVNTASVHVLARISGLDKRSAKKVYNHRPYKNRAALAKVLSESAFEQAAGFLRVPQSTEPLDNTDIHPSQYPLAHYVIEAGIQKQDFPRHASECKALYGDAQAETVAFIQQAYAAIGKDPRNTSWHIRVEKRKNAAEIKEGMTVEGVVRNVLAFGAFVDIGCKNDGLVHVSQIADRYVADPMEFVRVGDRVKVKVMKIDSETGKIQLSMKEAG